MTHIQKQHDQVEAAVGKSCRRRSVRRALAMTSNDGVDLQAIPQGTEPMYHASLNACKYMLTRWAWELAVNCFSSGYRNATCEQSALVQVMA